MLIVCSGGANVAAQCWEQPWSGSERAACLVRPFRRRPLAQHHPHAFSLVRADRHWRASTSPILAGSAAILVDVDVRRGSVWPERLAGLGRVAL
jgi:hypothetical protein